MIEPCLFTRLDALLLFAVGACLVCVLLVITNQFAIKRESGAPLTKGQLWAWQIASSLALVVCGIGMFVFLLINNATWLCVASPILSTVGLFLFVKFGREEGQRIAKKRRLLMDVDYLKEIGQFDGAAMLGRQVLEIHMKECCDAHDYVVTPPKGYKHPRLVDFVGHLKKHKHLEPEEHKRIDDLRETANKATHKDDEDQVLDEAEAITFIKNLRIATAKQY